MVGAEHKELLMPIAKSLIAELERAVDGLLVMSETDAPLHPFLWPQPLPFTPEAVLTAAGLPPETSVEEIRLERFFAPRITERAGMDAADKATIARFRALQRLLTERLRDVRVYRIGRIDIQVWIVGQTEEGRIAGLTTLVVET
jgi:hypothetical protein